MTTYHEHYARSLSDPTAFWGEAAEAIDWHRRWDAVLDSSRAPLHRWFAGGELNTCFNAVDRHADGERAEQVALIHDSPVTDTVRAITYRELRDLTARFAGVLAARGVGRGDRVIVYMPVVPEALVAMLACARLGAVHSVVFGGFAPRELASRIDDAEPVVIVSASCGIEGSKVIPYKPLLDEAIALSKHPPRHTVVLQRETCRADLQPGRDLDWDDAMADSSPHECVMVRATDPLYILYTSGTTGQPKGIVRDHGGHAVALHWSMKHVYGVDPGEVFWAASDIGWVVGHSYICYGPLLHGNTTVLFEGKPVGTPDPGAFWRVVEQHRVATLFTAPTAFRVIKQHDHEGAFMEPHDLSSLRTLFLAGERCDPDTLHWAEQRLGIPVVDHWWQTETGWPIAAHCLGYGPASVKAGSAGRPVPGWDVAVVGEGGEPRPPGEIGEIACRLPLPPGSLPTLWGADERFVERYLEKYPGLYQTDDAGYLDEDGYVFVMSRIDDIINVAGHRLSTGSMEEVLTEHPDISESAVIGVADAVKGQRPLGFLVLEDNATHTSAEIEADVIQRMRDRIGPVAAFKQALVVERLPKTRSGKVLRGTMRKMADGEEFKMPATIEDPGVLDHVRTVLADRGYPEAR